MEPINSLTVSEKFYSIQGEGVSVGMPAYFIRLKGCNLMCGGTGGAFVAIGKATWWCDTEVVWKQGTPVSFERIVDDWKSEGIFERILDGSIHIIWTGGEPTMPRSVSEIESFTNWFVSIYGKKPYYEIETNGTLVPYLPGSELSTDRTLFTLIDQINCSPKLRNSGMKDSFRIKGEVLKLILAHPNGWFKFVISKEEDLEEIRNDFLIPFNIPATRVCMMPGVDNLRDLPERTKFLFEMTKKYGYRGITRQHVLAWDKTTGV